MENILLIALQLASWYIISSAAANSPTLAPTSIPIFKKSGGCKVNTGPGTTGCTLTCQNGKNYNFTDIATVKGQGKQQRYFTASEISIVNPGKTYVFDHYNI